MGSPVLVMVMMLQLQPEGPRCCCLKACSWATAVTATRLLIDWTRRVYSGTEFDLGRLRDICMAMGRMTRSRDKVI